MNDQLNDPMNMTDRHAGGDRRTWATGWLSGGPQLYVDGERRPATGATSIERRNPADGTSLARSGP